MDAKATATASAGRPTGNKKAKAERAGAGAANNLDENIAKMIVICSSNAKESAEQSAARLTSMMAKADVKIKLGEEKVAAAKVSANATILAAMTEAQSLTVARMMQKDAITE